MRELRPDSMKREAASLAEEAKSHELTRHPPKVVLAHGLVRCIHDYIMRFREENGAQLETGGMLVGEFRREGGAPCFQLTDFIDAGPRAECSAESVLFDHEYQVGRLASFRRPNSRLGNMGCLHVHPGEMDECSTGDRLADIEAVRDSDTRALVFAIVTVNNPRRDDLSVRCGNLKLDLFVMDEQAGYEYQHVKPVLVDTSPAPRLTLGSGSIQSNAGIRFWRHHNKLPGVLGDKRRLVAEVRAMEERFGDRATLRYERSILFWEYTVNESSRRFPIEVRYPRRYPLEPPRVISRLPLPPSPHQLVGHELCWIDRSAQSDWNPARDTAATCINAAHRWFACLLVYLTLGEWPEEANDAPVRPC
jgi:hypothetical protein